MRVGWFRISGRNMDEDCVGSGEIEFDDWSVFDDAQVLAEIEPTLVSERAGDEDFYRCIGIASND